MPLSCRSVGDDKEPNDKWHSDEWSGTGVAHKQRCDYCHFSAHAKKWTVRHVCPFHCRASDEFLLLGGKRKNSSKSPQTRFFVAEINEKNCRTEFDFKLPSLLLLFLESLKFFLHNNNIVSRLKTQVWRWQKFRFKIRSGSANKDSIYSTSSPASFFINISHHSGRRRNFLFFFVETSCIFESAKFHIFLSCGFTRSRSQQFVCGFNVRKTFYFKYFKLSLPPVVVSSLVVPTYIFLNNFISLHFFAAASSQCWDCSNILRNVFGERRRRDSKRI